MDARTLAEVMGCSPARAEQMLPGYVGAMLAADITNINRAAMFAAQLGHESVGLQYMEEIASGQAYEGRADLGNTQPGDGRRYKGSGPIQLTGRNNFRAFTRWANTQGHTSIDFEARPELVRSDPRWGFLAASWYWTVARPQINILADRRDLEGVTRAINGGLNGLADRRRRYDLALRLGARLLVPGGPVTEKVLNYPRDQVVQDTGWNCGPASVQTAIRAADGPFIPEGDLARELGTHQGGTDWIGQFPAVLNRRIPGAQYRVVDMPQDPPTAAQRDRLWNDIVASINAGHGVVINIVAPPSNYPRAVHPSTISPAYGGGTVYHYFLAVGYSDGGGRRVWIADSGFSPYGYWISLDQLATLVPPKGYAYSATPAPTPAPTGGFLPMLNDAEQRELLDGIRVIRRELTQKYPSRSAYRASDAPVDTAVGMLLNADARVHEDWVHARAKELGITPEQFQRDYLKGGK